MGNTVQTPSSSGPSDDDDTEQREQLGDLLSGRLSHLDFDAVEAVRDEREP